MGSKQKVRSREVRGFTFACRLNHFGIIFLTRELDLSDKMCFRKICLRYSCFVRSSHAPSIYTAWLLKHSMRKRNGPCPKITLPVSRSFILSFIDFPLVNFLDKTETFLFYFLAGALLLLASGPSESHCSELFMFSTVTRSRLSGDIFINRVRRLLSSSPLFLSLLACTPMEDAFPPRGASSSCSPIGLRRASAAVTSAPAAPAALNGARSLSDSLQTCSARHGTDITPGLET